MKKIRYGLQRLDQSIQHSLACARHQLVAVGWIVFLGFPLFYWTWTEWFPQPYESLTLAITGSLFGLLLLLTPYWPRSLQRYLHWYWFVMLLFTLSFFFAYSFLMSHASVISAMTLLCSVFFLVLLVDIPTLLVLLFLGWGLALWGYDLNAEEVFFTEEHIEMLLVVFFVVVVGSTMNYKTALVQQKRLEGMGAAGGMIAHELRTPLLSIKSGAVAMSRYIPQLLKGYKLALAHGLIDSPIRATRLQQLEQVSFRITSETEYANTIIDMLLIKAGSENALQNCTLESCSMAQCLAETMARFPFKTEKNRQLVSWEGDFTFCGSKLLMQHVLFNLLKNALYAIHAAQKGEITVWTTRQPRHHVLHFRDTAVGMSERQVRRLFSPFYTTTFMGTGLGLAFCKLVMQRFGGDIVCHAEEGQFSEFQLYFPVAQGV